MEMDAASHTGVQNIRDAIIETVSYRAAQARYKIFIIDEVHMLSTSAFNALLKTLEEPPAHVKFLFATTEIRKVPVTVLSRCQRFDLRRIEPEVMIAHLQSVAAKERREIAEEALALITRASEGSVRDAMSLLDQAIAHGAGETGADQVRAMLGLADRGRVLDLFEAIMGGDAAGALAELGGQYADGADPRGGAARPGRGHALAVGGEDHARRRRRPHHRRGRTRPRAGAVRAPADARADADVADAAEGAGGGAAGPQRDDGRRDGDHPPDPCGRPADAGRSGEETDRSAALRTRGTVPRPGPAPAAPVARAPRHRATGGPTASGAQTALQRAPGPDLARYPTWDSVVALVEDTRDMKLLIEVKSCLRLVSYAPGRIELEPTENAPRDLDPG
jgi:DNA polymerase-3 subunit gamma/tau